MYDISIAIPLYNSEDFIARALESVLEQKTQLSFEIIVSDDASTDDSIPIVKGFMQRHENIRLLLHSENTRSGGKESFLDLYEACQGKYIIHLDSDDLMLPGRIQHQFEFMENHPDCAIGYGNAYAYSQSSKQVQYTYNENYYNYSHIPEIAKLKHLIMYGTFFCNSTKICRKSSVDFSNIRKLLFKIEHYIDLVMHVSMARHGDIARDDSFVAQYTIHDKSVCAEVRNDHQKRIRAYESMQRIIDYAAERENMSDEDVKKAKINNNLAVALYFLKHDDIEKYNNYIARCDHFGAYLDERHRKIMENRHDIHLVKSLMA